VLRKGKDYTDGGWHELAPQQTAIDLFGYLKKRNKYSNNNTSNTNIITTMDGNATRSTPKATRSPPPPPLITVVSRYESNESLAQVNALQKEGFDARMLPRHPQLSTQGNENNDDSNTYSAMYDFCYLMQAQGDIAGMARSTFYRFASLFGTSHRSWWVVVDTPQLRDMLGDEWYTFQHEYNWTHPVLQKRIRHRIFLPTGRDTNQNLESY
jgi:hypothetical protein